MLCNSVRFVSIIKKKATHRPPLAEQEFQISSSATAVFRGALINTHKIDIKPKNLILCQTECYVLNVISAQFAERRRLPRQRVHLNDRESPSTGSIPTHIDVVV